MEIGFRSTFPETDGGWMDVGWWASRMRPQDPVPAKPTGQRGKLKIPCRAASAPILEPVLACRPARVRDSKYSGKFAVTQLGLRLTTKLGRGIGTGEKEKSNTNFAAGERESKWRLENGIGYHRVRSSK